MPLATMGEIIGPARAAGRGVGAFNVIGIEHAEAIVTGAEAAGAPVVLQISENCAAYHGALEPIARACLAVARAAAVPVAVHLDHASGAELVRAASAFGLGSVMYDASRLPYARERPGHRRGRRVVPRPGRLGRGGARRGRRQGRRALPAARTDPDQAAGFVADTGVDALAVAVGSSHAMLTKDAVLDLGLIARLRRAVGVPLVLHGSSGVPDEDLAAAIRAGLTKINIATQLNKVFTAAVRDYLSAEPAVVDPRRYGSAGRDAIAPEVARLLGVLEGGAGEPLSPVERAARAAGLAGPAPGGGRGQGAERVRGHHPPGLRRAGQPADADQDPRRRRGRGGQLRPAAALQDRAAPVREAAHRGAGRQHGPGRPGRGSQRGNHDDRGGEGSGHPFGSRHRRVPPPRSPWSPTR